MKTALLASLLGLATTFSAQADSTWLGKIRLVNVHRGSWSTVQYSGQALAMNLCGYNAYRIYFDYYQAGVTDMPGVTVWQAVNAQVQLVQDSTQKVISQMPLPISGMDGNNAVYEIPISTIGTPSEHIMPSVVTGLDPDSQNTHAKIIINGKVITSLPLQFSCVNSG